MHVLLFNDQIASSHTTRVSMNNWYRMQRFCALITYHKHRSFRLSALDESCSSTAALLRSLQLILSILHQTRTNLPQRF